jgi:hypothetical protein
MMISFIYQYLTPKKSNKILSLASTFLYSDFSGLSTRYLRNCTLFRSLKLIALLLSFFDYYSTLGGTNWLVANCPAEGELSSPFP